MTPTEINNCSVLYDEDITVHFVVIFIIFFQKVEFLRIVHIRMYYFSLGN